VLGPEALETRCLGKAWKGTEPTVAHRLPEVVLAGALLERERQPHVAGADVPEEHAERVHVHRAVVLAREELGRHVDRRAHHAARHHRLRLAEAQVRDLGPVLRVQLPKATGEIEHRTRLGF